MVRGIPDLRTPAVYSGYVKHKYSVIRGIDMWKTEEGRPDTYNAAQPAFARRSISTSIVKVSLIIPTLNEALNLEYPQPAIPTVDELIIVDGGSTDGTVEVVERLRPEATVIVATRPGKGNALRAGFAGGQW